jgi:hypothetical protein
MTWSCTARARSGQADSGRLLGRRHHGQGVRNPPRATTSCSCTLNRAAPPCRRRSNAVAGVAVHGSAVGIASSRIGRNMPAVRLADVGLELRPGKTRIVYCKGADRRGDHEVTLFTFLGYEFRPRLARNKHGAHFVPFLPAVSREAMKTMGAEIRSWHWSKRSDKSLGDLAVTSSSIVQGWINYYGRFY